MIRRLAVVAVVTGFSGSCSLFTDPPEPCKNLSVRIIATSGPTPEISWDPKCGIGRLRISEDRIDGATLWSIGTTAGDLYPPVRYGQAPSHVVEVVPAQPLVPGTPFVSIYDREQRLIGQDKLQVR
ncbi:MAG: hypothetical protein H0X64_03450 [Gemmatimonadaceae bacterium]|nr:hypothetical protein [Gemmatimonadaceae bacterium]